MNDKLKLKIGDNWCVLKDDTEINIEMKSPLWNDSGSFSYSFSVPYKENIHILGDNVSVESNVNLKNFKKDFQLYADGICLLIGKAVTASDSVNLSENSVDLELRSMRADFNDTTGNININELDYSDVELGHKYSSSKLPGTHYPNWAASVATYLGRDIGDSSADVVYQKIVTGIGEDFINIPILCKAKTDSYEGPILATPYRVCSTPYFFLNKLIRRAFKQNDILYNDGPLDKIEDYNRIILMGSQFKYYEVDDGSEEIDKTVYFVQTVIVDPYLGGTATVEAFDTEEAMREFIANLSGTNLSYYGSAKALLRYKLLRYRLCPAKEALPDVTLDNLLTTLKDAFGLVILFDDVTNSVNSVLYRDVFRQEGAEILTIKDVISITKIHSEYNGTELSYGTADGDEFDYDNYNLVIAYDNFDEMLKEWNEQSEEKKESDTVLRIARDTGNFYRTKVDKDKFDNAQLFEVAQFIPYKADVDEDNKDVEAESIEMGFTPLIPTATIGKKNLVSGADESSMPYLKVTDAPYLDAEIELDKYDKYDYGKNRMEEHKFPSYLDYAEGISYNYAMEEKAKDISEYDFGDTWAIVRYNGDEASSNGYTEIKENSDGFGNSEWSKTVSENILSSDSISRDGQMYDYNGREPGLGIDPSQFISLRLSAVKQNYKSDNCQYTYTDDKGTIAIASGDEAYSGKPVGSLPNRGLIPQFLSEYLNFLKERKTVDLELILEVAEINNIKWEKYYMVAGYHCFIDSISFSASSNGIGVVKMRIYVI